jgi:hypothetical protein
MKLVSDEFDCIWWNFVGYFYYLFYLVWEELLISVLWSFDFFDGNHWRNKEIGNKMMEYDYSGKLDNLKFLIVKNWIVYLLKIINYRWTEYIKC